MQGQAVFYDPGRAAGSCGLGPFPAGGWYASLPPRSYASGRACGSYLDVSGPAGPVRAEVVDVCTDCAAGTVNLSRAAFARIADPRRGTVVVSYRPAVDPPLPGPLMLRIAAARPGRLAVQVINHGNRLSSVAASLAGRRVAAPGPGRRRLLDRAAAPGTAGPGRAPGGTAAARQARRRGRRAGPASASGSPTSRAIRWCSPAYRCAAPWCTPPRGCTGPRTGPLPGPPARPARLRLPRAPPGRPRRGQLLTRTQEAWPAWVR